MAFCRVVLPLLILTVVSASQVPVFLWGDIPKTSLKSNPLTKVTPEEFGGVLKKELREDQFCVIFIEETLSVEDFSKKNADGKTSYPYLHANIGDSLYLPSVVSPLRVLNKLADPEKVDHVKLTENGLSAEIKPESGKFLFINLKDAREGESRSDLLRRHNDFMEDMYTKLQERYDKVVAIYTAHYPSWTIPESHSRVRRQAEATSNDYALDGLLLYYNSLKLQEGRNTINLSGVLSNSTSFNNTEQNTTLNFGDNSVTLNFVSSGGYWLFKSVTLSQSTGVVEVLPATSEVYSLLGFSYRCAQQVSFANTNETKQYTLTFEDLKVQPFFQTGNASELVYGDSFNCVGFFSVPIWSGLFVVFILLSITFYGIMMMMDIRTMDRFDDPKGKTITINTSE